MPTKYPLATTPNLNVLQELSGVQERRRRIRARVHWQVRFLYSTEATGFVTITQNLSSEGFYCFSPVQLRCGDLMLCVLEIPTHQSVTTLLLNCRSRVIRVELNEDGFFGVGCQIEDYWFLSAADETASVELSAVTPS